MDLKVTKDKRALIVRAAFSALVIILLSAAGIAGIFRLVFSAAWRICIVNAIPLSIISCIPFENFFVDSAIRISSFVVFKSAIKPLVGDRLFLFFRERSRGFNLLANQIPKIAAAFFIVTLY